MTKFNKKIELILLLLIVFSTSVFAQNVGIGTTLPSHKLTVSSLDSNSVRLLGPGNFDSKARLTFGDVNRVFIEEDIDDRLNIFGLSRIALMGGNVGVGIKNPNVKFEVGTNNPRINLVDQLDGSSSTYAFAQIQGYGSNVADGISSTGRLWYLGSSSILSYDAIFGNQLTGGRLLLATEGTTRMTINNIGKVGIGNTDPAYNFEVIDQSRFEVDVSNPSFLKIGNINQSVITTSLVSAGNIQLVLDDNDNDNDTKTFEVKKDGTSGTTLLRVNENGNVGIGNHNPEKNLHIIDTDKPTILLQSSGSNDIESGRVSLRQQNDTGVDMFYDGAIDVLAFETFSGATNNGRKLTMDLSGNVGIGTLPGASTDNANGYRLSVNGKIAATEVRVQPTADWPDYVFANDYDLMPLDELQKSIDVNHHLPGIPSASEVHTNGITLGEMQRKSIEKIEELTLYLLEIHHEMNKIKTQLTTLELQNAALTKELEVIRNK